MRDVLYTSLVVVHVVVSVLYMGSIIHDLISKRWTEKQRQPAAIGYMFQKFVFTDAKITSYQAYLILGTGIGLTIMAGYNVLEAEWLWLSIVLFAISGLFFYIRLVPVQDGLRDWTTERLAVPAERYDWAEYTVRVRPWNFWVSVVTWTSFAALLLMIIRPDF